METKHQKKRLASIKSEVSEFHPLLWDLFKKLPQINNVEYTHGPNEMGADFILQKFDQTLSEESWIGVIAKIGPIKQDLHEIERQISECSISRFASGGNKNITFNEVWIVTTGSISNNAKIKINNNYKNTNIRFLDDNKLISLIDNYTPYFWYDVSHTISSYLTKLTLKNENRDTEANILGNFGNSFYIELEIEKIVDNPYKKKTKSKLVDFQKEVINQKLCLLEGEMGSGKSKIIRRIIQSTACVESYLDTGFIPVYTTFKELHDNYQLDYLACINKKVTSDTAQLDNENTKYLLLVDSVDEAFSSDDDGLDKLTDLAVKLNSESNIHAVFASRPIKRLDEETNLRKYFQRYSIKPLSINKIKEFIEYICKELSLPNKILNDISKSQLFKQLPHSPIAAILLSTLLAENSKDLPSNITELYAQAMEYMLGRWDVEKGLLTLKEYEASDALCGLLSEYMLDNNLSVLSISEAEDIFRTYLNERNLPLDGDAVFLKVAERSGVLAKDNDIKCIYFKHRSFAEFLYAKYKKRNHNLVIDSRVFDPYWSNTYFFYVGLHKDCPDLLEEILMYPTSTESERWLKILNMPNYFLAAFASPYRIVDDNLYKLFLDASQLFIDVINNKTDTHLPELPVLHILWIFQQLIKDVYSYEYFLKSLDGTVISIDEQVVDDQIKAYALFFLSVVAMDLNYDYPLEYLLNHYSVKNLPFSISLALQAESKFRKEFGKSPLMRRHIKQLKQLAKKSRSVRSAIHNLLENSAKQSTKPE